MIAHRSPGAFEYRFPAFGPLAEKFHDPLYEPANVLTDGRYFDNLSGQQAYKCFACRVRKRT